ncbi:MAG: hypothetical protein V5A62_10945 [Haloarculaceae archaeon]
MGDSERGRASNPDPGDHYRANGEGPVPSGYYRVVGRDADDVTLLYVGDSEGRRRHTGRVESIDRSALAGLEPAEAPRSGALAGAMGAAEGLWLSVRAVPGNLRDRPRQTLLALALLAATTFGPAFVTAPPPVFEVANLLGALLLGAAAAGLPR